MPSSRKTAARRQRARDPEDPFVKYRYPFSQFSPRTLASLHYHTAISDRLKALALSDDVPHLLFYGPSGAGKKTRIACTLRELFGKGAEMRRNVQRVVVSANRKYEVAVVQSNFHFEMNCGMASDEVVIQQLLKDAAETQAVNAIRRFKVLVLYEADSLSRNAQAALRRSLEKYAHSMRVILCTENIGRIIDPVKSRCLLVRVAAPTYEEMQRVLQYVSKRADFVLLNEPMDVIIDSASGNMRQAILNLESMRMQVRGAFKLLPIVLPDWNKACRDIGDTILTKQTPAGVLIARKQIYELLTRCISATVVFKHVAEYIVSIVDESIRADIMHWTAVYELRTHLGKKAIFHLEAWVVKVMRIDHHFLCGVPMRDEHSATFLESLV